MGINSLSLSFGLIIGIFIAVFVNTTFAQLNLEAEQEAYFEEKREYISDPDNGIHTYTSVCKGYYVDDGLGRVTGYGDLAEQYTYTYEKDTAIGIPTSTSPDIKR